MEMLVNYMVDSLGLSLGFIQMLFATVGLGCVFALWALMMGDVVKSGRDEG